MPFGTFTEYPSTNTSIASSGLGKWTRAPATGGRGDGGGGSGVGSGCGWDWADEVSGVETMGRMK